MSNPAYAPLWQQRRLALIGRAIAEVREVANRESSLQKAFRSTAAKYSGRALGGGHYLKISTKSLERFWYEARHPGGTSRLALRFGHPGKERIPQYARHLCAYMAGTEGLSVPGLYAVLKRVDPDLPFSVHTLRRHVPAAALARIKRSAVAASRATAHLVSAQAAILDQPISSCRAQGLRRGHAHAQHKGQRT